MEHDKKKVLTGFKWEESLGDALSILSTALQSAQQLIISMTMNCKITIIEYGSCFTLLNRYAQEEEKGMKKRKSPA